VPSWLTCVVLLGYFSCKVYIDSNLRDTLGYGWGLLAMFKHSNGTSYLFIGNYRWCWLLCSQGMLIIIVDWVTFKNSKFWAVTRLPPLTGISPRDSKEQKWWDSKEWLRWHRIDERCTGYHGWGVMSFLHSHLIHSPSSIVLLSLGRGRAPLRFGGGAGVRGVGVDDLRRLRKWLA
jgi:hypothetical protein